MNTATLHQGNVDSNFIDVVDLLNQRQVIFFATNGTLLGLARDKDLIPWDNDIDICVDYSDQELHSIEEELNKLGFQGGIDLRRRPGSLPISKFKRAGGRTVEIIWARLSTESESNFISCDFKQEWYRSDNPNWIGNKRFLVGRILKLCNSLHKKRLRYKYIFANKLGPILLFLERALERCWGLDETWGYYYSVELDCENPTWVDYYGVKIVIPANSEQICQTIYGGGWRTPTKSIHWTDHLTHESKARLKKSTTSG